MAPDVLRVLCHVLCVAAVARAVPLGSRTSGHARCTARGIAIYNVTFRTSWSRDAFYKQYPIYRPPAQWSKVIGRSHDPRYTLWRQGALSTPGMREFAEKGTTSRLDLDLQGHGGVFDVFNGANIQQGVGGTSTTVFVDANHHLVSLASHIMPSPDWFVGLDSEPLCSGGSWIMEKILDLRIWDAGTDKGFTFTAPNWAEDPLLPISEITSSYPNNPANSFYYAEMEQLPVIARVTFTRLHEDPSFNPNGRTWPGPGDSSAAQPSKPEGMKGTPPKEVFGILADPGVVDPSPSPVKVRLLPSTSDSVRVGKREPAIPKPAPSTPPPTTEAPITKANVVSKRKPKLSKEERRRLRREKKAKKAKKGKRGKKKKASSSTSSASSTLVGRRDVHCVVSEWSEWAPCSKTCGFGSRSRSRETVTPASGRGDKCPLLIEDQMCGSMRGCGWAHFNRDNWGGVGK